MWQKDVQEGNKKQFGILDIEFNDFIELLINNGFIYIPDSYYSITEKDTETVGK